MKKIIFAFVIGLLSISCSSSIDEEIITKSVEVSFNYSINKTPYTTGTMTRSAQNFYNEGDSIFENIFKPAIESGELLGDNIELNLLNINTKENIYIKTKQNNSVLLPIGIYHVTGTIGKDEPNCYGKTSLQINDTINIKNINNIITLHGKIQTSALIFADSVFTWTTYNSYSNDNIYKSNVYKNINYQFVQNMYDGYGERYDYQWIKYKDTTYKFLVKYGNYYYFKDGINYTNYIISMNNGFK